MHIVFIVGSYYPYYSAVSKCAGNVADEMSKSHRVTVLCMKNSPNQLDEEEYRRQKIIRICTKDNRTRFKFQQKINETQRFRRNVYRFFLKLYKISCALMTIFSRDSIKKELVKKFKKALIQIDESIDVIIPVSLPFEGVVAAIQYKEYQNREIKVIPYLFDQFAENDRLHRIKLNKTVKRRRHIRIEHEYFEKADSILAMHSFETRFSSALPEINKVLFVEHPLLVEPNQISAIKENDLTVIAYIGGLLKNYVEPNYLLELYKRTAINSTLHFYIVGNCSEVVDKYSRVMPNRIINHGSVDKETANSEIQKSDILISIAEKNGLQMSSKIFDYISHGKPIVHFYKKDYDVNFRVLEKYPNVLCIREKKELLTQNTMKFSQFCESNRDKIISFSEVSELFYDATPQYTAKMIEEIIHR